MNGLLNTLKNIASLSEYTSLYLYIIYACTQTIHGYDTGS